MGGITLLETTEPEKVLLIEKQRQPNGAVIDLLILGLRQDAEEQGAIKAASGLAQTLEFPSGACVIVDIANAQVRQGRLSR